MKGPTSGLSQQPGRSWGQLDLGGARKGGSSPDNDGTGRYCQTARVRQARQDGGMTSEPVVEPPQAATRLEPGGCGPDSSARRAPMRSMVRGDSDRHGLRDQGGHGEGLRRTRGEAAGEKLGTTPADRHTVNVGSGRMPPSPPCGQHGGGQVRRRLTASGRGGALVVVRGRESRLHGEGGQRVRRLGTGRPGGRW